MVASLRVDKLAGDADPIACRSHAPFKDILDTQVSGDVLDLYRLTFVREGGISGDDEEFTKSGKLANDVFGDAVGEVFLLGIAAHVGER